MPKGTPTIQPAKTFEYETPRHLFDQWWEEDGGYDMDPCCRPEHYTAQRVLENGGHIYVPDMRASQWGQHEVDGLHRDWHGKVYMNPPYGPALRQWIPYAVEQVERGNVELVRALLPAKTEVRWFQDYVLQSCLVQRLGDDYKAVIDKHPLCHTVRFLSGRLQFGGGEGPARVGSILVVWRK